MSKEKIKEYSNGELTVVWKPSLCIHAGECVRRLPKVYDPDGRPWITPENASTAALKEQIKACPSGALSFYMNDEPQQVTVNPEPLNATTMVEIMPNGPILVHGQIDLKSRDGKIETKGKTTALCRCGASNKKPYCDGSHSKIGSKG